MMVHVESENAVRHASLSRDAKDNTLYFQS